MLTRLLLLAITAYSFPLHAQQHPWQLTNHPPNVHVSTLYADDLAVYSGTFEAGVFASTNDGESWKQCAAPHGTVTEIIQVKNGPLLVGYLRHGVVRLDELGTSFTYDTIGLGNLAVTCLASDQQSVYAGTYDGLYQRPIKGVTWQRVKLPSGPYASHILSVLSTPKGLVAGGSQIVFHREPGNAGWKVSKLDMPADIISLSWWRGNIILGTSGFGTFTFTPNDLSAALSTPDVGLPTGGIVNRLRPGNGTSLVSLSTVGGLMQSDEIHLTESPTGLLRDYARRGATEFLATQTSGVYVRKPQLGKHNENQAGGAKDFLEDDLSDAKTSFSIYPSLVNNQLTVELVRSTENPVIVELIDTRGIVVEQAEIAANGRIFKFSDLNYPSGIYWCRLTTPEGHSSLRSFVVR